MVYGLKEVRKDKNIYYIHVYIRVYVYITSIEFGFGINSLSVRSISDLCFRGFSISGETSSLHR